MLSTQRIGLILERMQENDEEFSLNLDIILKNAVQKIPKIKELYDEILDFHGIYQVQIYPINFHFWVKIEDGSLMYKSGFNHNYNLSLKLPKDLCIKILRGEINAEDAYMKGKLQISGSINHAMKLRYFSSQILNYVEKFVKKN